MTIACYGNILAFELHCCSSATRAYAVPNHFGQSLVTIGRMAHSNWPPFVDYGCTEMWGAGGCWTGVANVRQADTDVARVHLQRANIANGQQSVERTCAHVAQPLEGRQLVWQRSEGLASRYAHVWEHSSVGVEGWPPGAWRTSAMVCNTTRNSAESNAGSRVGEGQVAQVANVPSGGVLREGVVAPSSETLNRVNVTTTPEQGVAPPGEEDLFARFLRDCNGAPNSPLLEPF